MEYRLHMGPWNSVFAVPTALVDRYLKLAGKEQLQVLLWMLRHGGEAFSPKRPWPKSWPWTRTPCWTPWTIGSRRGCLPAGKGS